MSKEIFDDECSGCKPIILDPTTMRPLTADHPAMLAVMKVWGSMRLDQKRAWHRFCCLNMRDTETIAIIQYMQDRMATFEKGQKNESSSTNN